MKFILGESKVDVENLIPRLNAITELNKEVRIYVRGDRGVCLWKNNGNNVVS